MSQMKIGTKLYSIVGFMSMLTLIVGGVGLYAANVSNDGLDTVFKDRVVPLEQLKNVSDLYAVNIVDTSHKTRDGALSWAEARKNVADAKKKVVELWKAYTETYLVPEEKKLVAEITPLMQKADTAVSRLNEILAKEDRVGLTRFAATELYPAIDPVTDKLEKLVDVQLVVSKQEYERSDSLYKKGIVFSIILIIAGLMLATTFATLIIKGLLKQLGGEPDSVREIALSVAEGDLSIAVNIDPRDHGSVLWAMGTMVDNLHTLIAQTANVSAGIASASSQLHATSDQIATGAEEVASQTTTVASASEEMSSTSSDIARNCALAAENSQKSSQSANCGALVVQETIAGMAKIAERVKLTADTVGALGTRSEQIGEIIETIEDIADQTNLLALNAAIEAARAGEQGRGFAVVADEVRALAERTTKATKEIGEMIKAIQTETKGAVAAMEEGVHEVEKGSASSQKSGEALQEILHEIDQVTMQINQIATAAEEQTATTSEITSNIQQVTAVIQQTARGAEETSAAASVLAEQARQLQTVVGRFKVA